MAATTYHEVYRHAKKKVRIEIRTFFNFVGFSFASYYIMPP